MKLLKNQQEFEEWNAKQCDPWKTPKEFPCYIINDFEYFDSEGNIFNYLYRNDIEKMLMSLLPPNATVKISTP